MRWFRRSRLDPLAVSMSGVKLGDRVLMAGAGDVPLIVALATKAGLTGRTCVVDPEPGRAASAARAAEREGALVEAATAAYSDFSFENESFDVVVLRDVLGGMVRPSRDASVGQALRVLRPGGRCLVIEATAKRVFGGLLGRGPVDESYATGGGAVRALEEAGFAGVRLLAEREGLRFVEGVKKNEPVHGLPASG